MEELSVLGGARLTRFQTPGGADGSIVKTEPKAAPAAINYVSVDDIKSAVTKVKRAGGEIIVPIVELPHMGHFFWFRVPGGPVLAAWQDAPDRKD